MLELKRTAIFLSLIFIFSQNFAQENFQFHLGKVKHRLSAGPVMSFYKNNLQQTINTKAKPGFNAAYKSEIFLDRKTNLIVGLEYLSQGFTFHGYYSAPNHTYLFDKIFPYSHEIHYQEIQLPILLKNLFKAEVPKSYSPYYFLGIGFRYIFKSSAFITSDSTQNTIYDGKTDVTFENHFLNKHFNALFQCGLGTQRNFKEKGSTLFIEFTYKYNISRLHYEGYQNSNNLNIRDACLSITVGFRF